MNYTINGKFIINKKIIEKFDINDNLYIKHPANVQRGLIFSDETNDKKWYIGETAPGSKDIQIHSYNKDGNILINPNSTEKLRITKDGNLGIGSNDPKHKLEIKSTGWSSDSLPAPDNLHLIGTGSGGPGIGFTNDNSNEGYIYYGGSTSFIGPGSIGFVPNDTKKSSDVAMTIKPNGNIGIGTTKPNTSLTIKKSGTTGWTGMISVGNQERATIMGVNNNKCWIGGHKDYRATGFGSWDDLIINANGGNVGIGINEPDEKLHIEGTVKANKFVNQEGVDMSVGPQGPIGEPGPTGIQGREGIPGPVGPRGPPSEVKGPPGVKGDRGPPGVKGDNQIEIRKTTTHIQWKYKQTNIWYNLISITELKGDKGDMGPSQGPPGVQGERGQIGDRGLSGGRGHDGPPGPHGPPGPPGACIIM
jgi:hypothetical protein